MNISKDKFGVIISMSVEEAENMAAQSDTARAALLMIKPRDTRAAVAFNNLYQKLVTVLIAPLLDD